MQSGGIMSPSSSNSATHSSSSYGRKRTSWHFYTYTTIPQCSHCGGSASNGCPVGPVSTSSKSPLKKVPGRLTHIAFRKCHHVKKLWHCTDFPVTFKNIKWGKGVAGSQNTRQEIHVKSPGFDTKIRCLFVSNSMFSSRSGCHFDRSSFLAI